MKRLLVFALVVLPAIASAQTAALEAFAMSNVDKFATEIKGLPKTFTVRYVERRWAGLMGQYDPVEQKFVNEDSMLSTDWVWYPPKCTPAGSFVGQNAYGAKSQVTRLNCSELVLEGGDSKLQIGERGAGADFRRLVLPMTPNQYREAKAKGLMYEFQFTLAADTKEQVVRGQRVVESATISSPYEKHRRIYKVRGQFGAPRVLSADGKTEFARYDDSN